MLKERPTLFSTDMVVSILENRKTKTRRTKGLDLINENPDNWILEETFFNLRTNDGKFDKWGVSFKNKEYASVNFIACPYGKSGDVIWVRETFFDINKYLDVPLFAGKDRYLFKADGEFLGCHKWKPSIHMPKAAARIWLEITDIKVERLQDIGSEDAIAEGIKVDRKISSRTHDVYYHYPCGSSWDRSFVNDPITSFMSLWISINGTELWELNPWVWVISFKVLSTNGRPAELDDIKEVRHA